jgi:carboxymethylenebutenolidase
VNDTIAAGTITITGHGGDQIEAYAADPQWDGSRGGVVVIHHLPGYDAATKEMVRRFAVMGYDAVCPNLYHREAPGADPDDAAATVRAQGGVPDDRLVGDVAGAAEYLRGLPSSNGKVAVIGHCSGGRHAVLSAVSLPLQAAIDCYGAFVSEEVPSEYQLNAVPLLDRIPGLSCPLLGLFGVEDKHPSPEHVAVLDRALTEHGKEHEFHSFEDAGHAFFAVDRPSYRPKAATEGWQIIDAFLARHLS